MMVAFNFKAQFVPLVEARVKRQTIRKSQRCTAGDKLQLYTGMRTAQCRKLVADDPVCTSVGMVMLSPWPDEFKYAEDLHQRWLDNPDPNEFARADGFADYDDMLIWFRQTYGVTQFVGYVHKWDWPASPEGRLANQRAEK